MSGDSPIETYETLSQQFLSTTWDELQVAQRMTACVPSPSDPDALLMVSAFSDVHENAMYVQPMDGDTMYDDQAKRQVVYTRRRVSTDCDWGPWIRSVA